MLKRCKINFYKSFAIIYFSLCLFATAVFAKGSFTIKNNRWVKSRYECVIRDIAEDKDRNIYLATFGSGLFVYNFKENTWFNYKKCNSCITDDRLSKIIIDEESLYIASAGGGAYKLNRDNNQYQITKLTNNAIHSLYYHTILKLPNKAILLGSVEDGIYIIKDNESLHISEGVLPSNWVNDAIIDEENNRLIWIATSFGVVLIDYQHTKPLKVLWELNKFDALDVNVIRQFNKCLYVGSANGGLIKIAYDLKKLENKSSSNITKIRDIPTPVHALLSAEDKLLVGTEMGLYVVSKNDVVEKVNSIRSNEVIKSIANTSYGVLVGTDNGVVYRLSRNFVKVDSFFDYRKFVEREVRE